MVLFKEKTSITDNNVCKKGVGKKNRQFVWQFVIFEGIEYLYVTFVKYFSIYCPIIKLQFRRVSKQKKNHGVTYRQF